MSTGYYLLDHPNRVKQYGAVRRNQQKPSGTVVVHTAENATDFEGEDLGAEQVAKFIANRADYGSYHSLADFDSIVPMAPWAYETWNDTRTNNFNVGISGAVRSADWPRLGARGDQIVINMARSAQQYAAWLLNSRGIIVPARRITRAEALNKKPGFIGHGEIDTGRRSDPGASFNWDLFLATFAGTAPAPTPTPTPPASTGIAEDGIWGAGTTTRAQQVLGTTVDGEIWYQYSGNKQPGLTSGWVWNWYKGCPGSPLIKAMQRGMGINPDGVAGKQFWTAFQTRMGTHADGEIWYPSPAVQEFQRRLNRGTW